MQDVNPTNVWYQLLKACDTSDPNVLYLKLLAIAIVSYAVDIAELSVNEPN